MSQRSDAAIVKFYRGNKSVSLCIYFIMCVLCYVSLGILFFKDSCFHQLTYFQNFHVMIMISSCIMYQIQQWQFHFLLTTFVFHVNLFHYYSGNLIRKYLVSQSHVTTPWGVVVVVGGLQSVWRELMSSVLRPSIFRRKNSENPPNREKRDMKPQRRSSSSCWTKKDRSYRVGTESVCVCWNMKMMS